MEDSTQNTVKIHNQDEALSHVDTTIRQKWNKWAEDNSYPPLGEATIAQEAEVEGHKAWQYHIDGLLMSRDGRKRWLLDTGETFDTTLSEDENTLEKALGKLRKRTDNRNRAISLLGVKAEDLRVADADGVGTRFYEDVRGGKSLIIGNDGGLLFANSSVSPSDHIQAYKDGKRTSEDAFNQSN